MTATQFRRLTRRAPELPALAIAVLAIAWCLALWSARAWFTGSDNLFYLVYNLALAAIPLVAGAIAVRLRQPFARAIVFACWLGFYPNAPYLMTDLIHLRPRPESPFWFDWLLFLSMAATGLMIAVVSMAQIHRWLTLRLPAWKAGAVVAMLLPLVAFGIYLGRFLRWNTWDLVFRPLHLLGELVDLMFHPLGHPRMLAYSLGVTFLLALSYFGPLIVFRTLLAQPAATPKPSRLSPSGDGSRSRAPSR